MTDTHCHLNDLRAFPEPHRALDEARAAGVSGFVIVGIEPETSRIALEIAERHPDVWAVIGHHPNHAHEFSPALMTEYEAMARHPKAVAIGETGLDYHWDFSTPTQQFDCFDAMLDLAVRLEKPLVIHCREAYSDLLDHLEAWNPGSGYDRGIHFHCFAGSAAEAHRALALRGFLGVDGPITYPKSVALRELVATLPRDRVVLETDSPYLSPVPYRGKPNSPAYLPFVLKEVALAWDVSESEAEKLTDAAAMQLFGLP